MAALGGDPLEVGVGHVDWILLDRVYLVNQLVSIVDLVPRQRLIHEDSLAFLILLFGDICHIFL